MLPQGQKSFHFSRSPDLYEVLGERMLTVKIRLHECNSSPNGYSVLGKKSCCFLTFLTTGLYEYGPKLMGLYGPTVRIRHLLLSKSTKTAAHTGKWRK